MKNKRSLTVFHINIQCISNKVDQINSIPDIAIRSGVLCFSEHWMSEADLKLIKINGFQLVSFFCRKNHQHGGVSIFLNNNIDAESIFLNKFCDEINAEFCGIKIKRDNLLIIACYRSCLGDPDIFLIKFEEILNKFASKKLNLIILGDFNINFNGNSHLLSQFNWILKSYGLKITVFENTRITLESSTCIDNIITNMDDTKYISYVSDVCLSDHLGQYIVVESPDKVPVTRVVRPITNSGVNMFRSLLSQQMSDFAVQHKSVNDLADFLISTYSSLTLECFPLKSVLVGSPPVKWFSPELREMRNTLFALKTVCNHRQEAELWSCYKLMLNHYKKSIKMAKRTAYDNYLLKSQNKVKASWNLVTYETNNRQSYKRNNSEISEAAFNQHFSLIAEKIISSLPSTNAHDFIKLAPSPNRNFFLFNITQKEVYDALMYLKNSSSTDYFNLNSKILKETVDFLVTPLTDLYNASVTEGIFPCSFKISKITPIFKKGDLSDINNYRPISITVIFGKVFEIILKDRLSDFFEKNNLLSSSQFGFRKNNSTIKALLKVVEDVVGGLEEGAHVQLTMCDLTKAFDCVSHDLLIAKLNHYGVRGLPLKLITSYLNERRQCVSLGPTTRSDVVNVKYGVPQGSVLGPLLFIIYINDLTFYMSSFAQCSLFADDTSFLNKNKDVGKLMKASEQSLKSSQEWFTANKLKLNEEKTQILKISTNHMVTTGKCCALLGVIIDDSLSWLPHITKLGHRLSSSLFVLRQLRCSLSLDVLKMVYYSLFHSHLSYGVVLWGASAHSLKIFRLQKKAVRLLANVNRREHCEPLFKKYKIMTLPALYIYYSLLEIHSKSPNLLLQSQRHHYKTRGHNNVIVPFYRLNKSSKNSLNLNFFNKLSYEIRTLEFNKFKLKIKSFLLEHPFYHVDEFLKCSDSL